MFAGAGIVLAADLFAPRRGLVVVLTVLVLIGAAVWAIAQVVFGTEGSALGGAVTVDSFALFFAFLLIGVTLAIVFATFEGLSRVEHHPEFFVHLLDWIHRLCYMARVLKNIIGYYSRCFPL